MSDNVLLWRPWRSTDSEPEEWRRLGSQLEAVFRNRYEAGDGTFKAFTFSRNHMPQLEWLRAAEVEDAGWLIRAIKTHGIIEIGEGKPPPEPTIGPHGEPWRASGGEVSIIDANGIYLFDRCKLERHRDALQYAIEVVNACHAAGIRNPAALPEAMEMLRHHIPILLKAGCANVKPYRMLLGQIPNA